jgi:FAD/FMN-containing dehydrogenase
VLEAWKAVYADEQKYWTLYELAEKLVDFEKFFYPLDTIADWNRIYGKRGFIQYQVYFPDATARDGMRETLNLLSESGLGSFLAVLKRSGAANSFPLSFLSTGYTLALDIPVVPGKLDALMVKLEVVLKERQGRVYFAKDACVSPALMPQMYPRVAEFREVKGRVDPNNQLRSRLSDRIGLT